MTQESVYKGVDRPIGEIQLTDIHHDPSCDIAPRNVRLTASYDIGPTSIFVPTLPPVWTPHELPVAIPRDGLAVDPRTILPANPLDPLLRAANITCPDLDLKALNLITDRKNLRALLDFAEGRMRSHRIDVEIIGGTVLFFLGWAARGYNSAGASFGVNFERHFTTPLSDGAAQHNCAVRYMFGGLDVMVKYQADACKASGTARPGRKATVLGDTTTPNGLRVQITPEPLVDPETIVEIKTLRGRPGEGNPTKSQTMAQLWFSRTPILIVGYHDGKGHFDAVDEINVHKTGQLDRWQEGRKESLQKLVRVLQLIEQHMVHSMVKKQAIILSKKSLTFYSLDSSYDIGLPDDLREKWD